MGIFDKLRGKSGEDEYVDIDLGQFEEISGGISETLVRLAELKDVEVLPEIKQEILEGNIVLVDITSMKGEKTMLDQAIAELKTTAEDVRGDIAGVSGDLILVVPKGMRIDREGVIGGKK